MLRLKLTFRGADKHSVAISIHLWRDSSENYDCFKKRRRMEEVRSSWNSGKWTKARLSMTASVHSSEGIISFELRIAHCLTCWRCRNKGPNARVSHAVMMVLVAVVCRWTERCSLFCIQTKSEPNVTQTALAHPFIESTLPAAHWISGRVSGMDQKEKINRLYSQQCMLISFLILDLSPFS